jgi:hypothetical protein
MGRHVLQIIRDHDNQGDHEYDVFEIVQSIQLQKNHQSFVVCVSNEDIIENMSSQKGAGEC